MTKKQKNVFIRILISFVLLVVLILAEHLHWLSGDCSELIMYVSAGLVYLLIGYDILWKAFRNICHGQIFDENFLMVIATIGAFFVKELSEAVAVMLFYQIGELFQSYAVGKSRKSISDMMSICPEYANIEQDGELIRVEPEEVNIGDCIVIKPGERIPLDGTIAEGDSFIDTSALTGESVPRHATVNDTVCSGCINQGGILKVKVDKEFEDSTVAKILELVENASSKKAQTEKFITKFAKWYTPMVTISALLLAFIPPLILRSSFLDWLQRACIFLVISCPCALVISVPLSFFGGIGAASKCGVLIKGSNFIEAVAKLKTIVFDKTGTLTKGEFKVTQLLPNGLAADELLRVAAYAEGYSSHPIANSIRLKYEEALNMELVKDVKEIPGMGIIAEVEGKKVLSGNAKLMEEYAISYESYKGYGTSIYVAVDEHFVGTIIISDDIKEGAKEALERIHESGIDKCVMLTGDRQSSAEFVKEELHIDEVHAELLPDGKVNQVEMLLQDSNRKGNLAFVGDGINDAPVLTRADVGIAMGSLGSDAAIEAADIVIMDDDLRKISKVIIIARKTIRIVKQNIVFALAVKAIVLILGAIGVANMWEAVFADVGVSVIAILNAMRALKYEK